MLLQHVSLWISQNVKEIWRTTPKAVLVGLPKIIDNVTLIGTLIKDKSSGFYKQHKKKASVHVGLCKMGVYLKYNDPDYMLCIVLSNASEKCTQPSLHTGLFMV
nr:hypothetical protein CFP56_70190 [Quercus suber]